MSYRGCQSILPGGVTRFNGLYSTGTEDVTVPPDHAVECINCVFAPKQVGTRSGLSTTLSLGFTGARKVFQGTPGNLFFLVLNKTGSIYIDGTTLLLAVSGMNDFGALNMYERVYISPHGGYSPIANQYVRVWDGSTIRLAAGYAPTAASPMTYDTVNAGRVEKGIHKFAVSYETDSGFITPPGPKIATVFTPTSVDCPGEKRVNLYDVPIGPSGTVARHIFATKANEEEYFFVPDGKIWGNSSTTHNVDFYDNELIASADHLFDLLEVIPAGLGLAKYRGRMVLWGFSGDQVYVSRIGEPEAFSTVDGILHVPTESDGNNVKAVVTLRDVLYLFKFTGIYVTEDNSAEPSTWGVIRAEGGVGSYANGIASIVAAQAGLDTEDLLVFASKAGLFVFDGMVRRPELSWKVSELWKSFNPDYFYKVTVTHDVWNKMVYIVAPTGTSTENNLVLMVDYSDGWEAMQLKWSTWVFPFAPSHIGMSSSTQDGQYRLRLVGLDEAKMYDLDPEALVDGTTDIASSYKCGPVGQWAKTVFRGVQIAARGLGGNLDVRVEGQSGTPHKDLPSYPLGLTPKEDYIEQFNLECEQLYVKFSSADAKFVVSGVDVLGKPRRRGVIK